MEYLGVIGFIFGFIGFLAYFRVEKLEKKLKESGALPKDFSSE